MTIKKVVLRGIAVLLMIGSVVFGMTWKKNGYCLGDELLNSLGLKAWSGGTQGTHYTALYALGLLLAAIVMYAMTTEKRLTTFRYFLIGIVVVSVLSSMVF